MLTQPRKTATATHHHKCNPALAIASQMGAAGGTPEEAAYAAASAAAAQGPTVDDTWYAARASATLDAIKHRQAGNRDIINSILQVTLPTLPGRAAHAMHARVLVNNSGQAPTGSSPSMVSKEPVRRLLGVALATRVGLSWKHRSVSAAVPSRLSLPFAL